MPCNLLPAQLGFYLNALATGRFEKTNVAFRGFKSGCGVEELRTGILRLLRRQPSLRHAITWAGTEPRITERGNFRLDLLDGCRLPAARIPDTIEGRLRELEQEISASDSSAGLLAALPGDRFELYLFIDHMYCDAVSVRTLESELQALWRGEDSHDAAWPAMSEALTDELTRAERIRRAHQPTAGPSPWVPGVGRHTGKASRSTIPVRISGPGWERTMASARATDFQIVLASYGLALSAAFHCRDFVVGVPTAGIRMHEPRLESPVGCYTNTVYLRIDTGGCSTFGDILDATRFALIEAIDADVPATVEIGWEFAAAAARKEWWIRRLNYPVVIEMLKSSGDPGLIRLIDFPYSVGGAPRRLMSLAIERSGRASLRLRAASDSSDAGISDGVTHVMAGVLRDVADRGAAAADGILEQVAAYAPATGGRPRASGARPRGTHELAAWLDRTLRGEAANEVVTDELADLGAGAREHAPATDVLSVIRAYVLHPGSVRGMPAELVRRDASPAGLALSRRLLKAR